MKNIIIYASLHGFTERCVETLKDKLTDNTTLYKAGSDNGKPNLQDYDNIIIGGPVYVSKIRPELVKFINENMDTLLEKSLFLFTCSGDMDDDYVKKSLPEEIYRKALHKAHFGAELDYSKLGFIEGIIMRLMGKKEYSRMKTDAIKEMADNVNRVTVKN